MGFRIGTIPIEDFFYAMLLLLSNISIFEWLQFKVTPKTVGTEKRTNNLV
jgi:hypothetical protein